MLRNSVTADATPTATTLVLYNIVYSFACIIKVTTGVNPFKISMKETERNRYDALPKQRVNADATPTVRTALTNSELILLGSSLRGTWGVPT